MKKTIFLLLSFLLLPLLAFAKVHYAKVEPVERTTIKSSVTGAIIMANLHSEGKQVGDEVIIQIDDVLDRASLKTSQASLKLLKQMFSINEEVLKGLKETHAIKQDYFKKINGLQTSSKTQKDNAYNAFVAAKNQMLGTQEKLATLKNQILETEQRIVQLEDTIAKKRIVAKGRYLYKLMVRQGEFASPGLPLAIVDDLRRAKLTLYLDREELEGLKNKTIHINGKPTKLRFDRVWKETDETFISSYRAEIILEPAYPFSSLLKVELIATPAN